MYFRSAFLTLSASFLSTTFAFAQGDLAAALADGANDRWSQAYTQVSSDPLAWELVTWSRLRDGDGSFDEYRAFVARFPSWPGMARLRSYGEAAITNSDNPADIIAWFADEMPQTGEGVLHYANALARSGNATAAARILGEAWLTQPMTEKAHNDIIDVYGPVLSSLHMLRATNLIWQESLQDAERMIPLLSAQDAQVITTAVQLARSQGGARGLLQELPPASRQLPMMRFALFEWLMQRNEFTDAVRLLGQQTKSAANLQNPINWADGRRILARWEMREGRADSAYALASQHFLSVDDGFVFHDLEWLSGYLSLTYLNDPDQALTHFARAGLAAEHPVAAARVGYWTGRAYEAKGDASRAAEAYGQAARFQTAFYGLLAAEKVGRSFDQALLGKGTYPELSQIPAGADARVRAALALADAGERNGAFLFTTIVAQDLTEPELGALGTEFLRRGHAYYALVIGKNAAERGIILPDIYFPMHDIASLELPVEAELALSIARQESEFVETAASPVGALGLMQLMPATAEEVAGQLGLEFATSRLTSDWEYNVTLGSQYLADLQARFGDTPVMIAAGYNAGPSRPSDWMAERGDPRIGDVDVVDWIEHIPFRETRNYVQRVTEAIPIYRAQLNGSASGIVFSDILAGRTPLIRPRLRPYDIEAAAPQPVAAPTTVAITPTPAPQVPEPSEAPSVAEEQFPVAETFAGDTAISIVDFGFGSVISPDADFVIPDTIGTVWSSQRPVIRPDR